MPSSVQPGAGRFSRSQEPRQQGKDAQPLVKGGHSNLKDFAESLMGYLPGKVYLHSDTRTGAINLLGKLPRKTYLNLEELPAAFRIAGVSASDVENILCIYKVVFLRVKE